VFIDIEVTSSLDPLLETNLLELPMHEVVVEVVIIRVLELPLQMIGILAHSDCGFLDQVPEIACVPAHLVMQNAVAVDHGAFDGGLY